MKRRFSDSVSSSETPTNTPPRKRRLLKIPQMNPPCLAQFLPHEASQIVDEFSQRINAGGSIPADFAREMSGRWGIDRMMLEDIYAWVFPGYTPLPDDSVDQNHEEEVQPRSDPNDSEFLPYSPTDHLMYTNTGYDPHVMGGMPGPAHSYPDKSPPTPHIEDADDDDEADDLTKPPPMHRTLSQFPAEYLDGHYSVDKYIGKGAYGIVALGEATNNNPIVSPGTKVAIKKMSDIFSNVTGTKRLLRELRVLRSLKGHSCIVKLLDIKIPHPKDINDFDEILLVFEWIEWDLHKLMKRETFLKEMQVKAIIKQILYGLKFMHSANIVHRDLKPANILMNLDCDVKVCDFGLSRCIEENMETPISQSHHLMKKQNDIIQLRPLAFKPQVTQHVVTRYYRAPEVCMREQERELLPKIDVWAVGCVLGELLDMMKENCDNVYDREPLFPGVCDQLLSPQDGDYGRHGDRLPHDQLRVIFDFCGTPDEAFIEKIKNPKTKQWLRLQEKKEMKNLNDRFVHGPEGALDLMKQLFILDPEHRISISDALKHPWLKDCRLANEKKLNKPHEGDHFEFEDVSLTRQLLRELIVDEILIYNDDLQDQLTQEALERRAARGTSSFSESPVVTMI